VSWIQQAAVSVSKQILSKLAKSVRNPTCIVSETTPVLAIYCYVCIAIQTATGSGNLNGDTDIAVNCQ